VAVQSATGEVGVAPGDAVVDERVDRGGHDGGMCGYWRIEAIEYLNRCKIYELFCRYSTSNSRNI
jgi:hypothetical protein